MIEFSEARVEKLIVHRVNMAEPNPVLTEDVYELRNDEEEEFLLKMFLKPFTNQATTYEFKHDIDIDLNPLFKISQSIFDEEDFVSKSKSIYTHLKTVSKHANIKDGDLFIVKYGRIRMKQELYDGIGIYKVESKESFIETTDAYGDVGLNFKKGIGLHRLDKACLILRSEEPYTLFLIDNNSTETEYWKSEFVKVTFKNDHINSTNQFLGLAKAFVTEQIPTEYEATRADQIDMLNRSVQYFKSHENFNKKEFEEEVFQNEEMIQSFRTFDKQYQEDNGMDLSDNFEISHQAVKKQARVFKSILKLDKNFHIYIHGDRSLIEQGRDSDGRKYYKIYFEEES